MNEKEVIKTLRSWASAKNVAGMARFGINPKNTLGVPIPKLRSLAKKIGKDHALAQALWDSRIHEARILAAFIDVPELVSEKQLERWVKGIDSWDVCDQVCGNLFDRTAFAHKKALAWTERKEEFVKRAGYVSVAAIAVHDKRAKDKDFEKFFSAIIKGSTDERNFVRKAVNWALRQIGKRNLALNKRAIVVAKKIQTIDDKSARWIAADALRELTSEKIQKYIRGHRR
jgi:3-methyladenine DNA glycosylase AlkD